MVIQWLTTYDACRLNAYGIWADAFGALRIVQRALPGMFCKLANHVRHAGSPETAPISARRPLRAALRSRLSQFTSCLLHSILQYSAPSRLACGSLRSNARVTHGQLKPHPLNRLQTPTLVTHFGIRAPVYMGSFGKQKKIWACSDVHTRHIFLSLTVSTCCPGLHQVEA